MSNTTSTQTNDQYSLAKILGIWAVAAAPMGILAWVISPALASRIDLAPGIIHWILMIVGMAWLFVWSMIVLYRELGTLRWSVIRIRMWFQMPRDPKTDEPKARLLWWALPAAVLNALVMITPVMTFLDKIVTTVFPFFAMPAYADTSGLASPEFVGQWWLLGVVLASNLFNHFLGEEFLFRGVLLPKMEGVFGKWDWVANTALFSLFHWHMPWHPLSIMAAFAFSAWASRRFKSNWIFVIAHGVDGVFLFLLVLAVITGLAF